MTETLRIIGSYHIQSEKKDQVPPEWADWCLCGGIFILIVLISTAIVFGYLYFPGLELICASVGLVIAMFIAVCLITFPRKYAKCGVTISLVNWKGCIPHLSNPPVIRTKDYPFSGDAEKDALEINQIVERFSDEANKQNRIDEEWQRIKEENAKNCCNQYRDVMEKIKGGNK